MTAPTLYRIVDEYPYLEREDEYPGLTLTEAAIRMDDLTGCGEDVILADWDEPCERCEGSGEFEQKTGLWLLGFPATRVKCRICGGDGKWPGPWEWSDDETNRMVTMMREVS
jgi:hypothetical protein